MRAHAVRQHDVVNVVVRSLDAIVQFPEIALGVFIRYRFYPRHLNTPLRHHQKEQYENAAECRKTQRGPDSHQFSIIIPIRAARDQVSDAHLNPDYGYPASANKNVKTNDRDEPGRAERYVELAREPQSGYELNDDSGRGEKPVRHDDVPSYDGHRFVVFAEISLEHEKSDSHSRTKQHGGTQDVQQFDPKIGRHCLLGLISAPLDVETRNFLVKFSQREHIQARESTAKRDLISRELASQY